MSALDYSKWDAIGDSDDDDEAAAAAARGRPHVTRLDAGSRITIGSAGWAVGDAPTTTQTTAPGPKAPRSLLDYSKWDHLDESDGEGEENAYYEDEWHAKREEELKAQQSSTTATTTTTTTTVGAHLPRRAKEKPQSKRAVDDDDDDDWIVGWREGGGGGGGGAGEASRAAFAWRQSAEEVVAEFAVPLATRARDVTVRVTFQRPKCVLSVKAPAVAVEAALMHDVWCAADDRPNFRLVANETTAADFAELDWEVVAKPAAPRLRGARAVRLVLRKRPPCPGVVAWWPRLFHEPQRAGMVEVDVDTTRLRARAPRSKPEAVQAFEGAWRDAHDQFVERTSKIEPDYIDVGGGGHKN